MDSPLAQIFEEANGRIQGKGAARHGSDNLDFLEQPLFSIPESLLADESPMLFQAVKKIFESRRLSYAPSRDELLDAIVYIAAAIIHKAKIASK